MTNAVWDWVAQRVLDRIGTLLSGWLATTAEARLIRAQAETLRELEALADQYEQQGKEHLGHRVRQQAARLTLASAGESAASVLQNLSQDDRKAAELPGLPAPPNGRSPSLGNTTDKPRRPTTKTGRRRGRPPKQPSAQAE